MLAIQQCTNEKNFKANEIQNFYDTNCKGKKDCKIDLGGYIKLTAEEQCRRNPARVFI